MKFILALLIGASCILAAKGQPSPLPLAPPFMLNVKTFETTGSIPFDKYFILVLKEITTGTQTVIVELHEGVESGVGLLETFTTIIPNPETVQVPIARQLKANKKYHFAIRWTNAAGNILGYREYAFSARTKTGDYLKVDLGVGYVPSISGVVSQTAVHLYLLPTNDDVDLMDIAGLGKNIFLRTSAFVGISPVKLYSNTEVPITNATSVGNLLFGVGIRSPFYGKHTPFFGRNLGWILLQPMRINIGQMYFLQDNASPIITKNKDKLAFYFGVSYDIKLSLLLGPVGKILTP